MLKILNNVEKTLRQHMETGKLQELTTWQAGRQADRLTAHLQILK